MASGERQRTCRACGNKFDYPVKGSVATRHHCADCVVLKPEIRQTFERLNTRMLQLERQIARLEAKNSPAKPANA